MLSPGKFSWKHVLLVRMWLLKILRLCFEASVFRKLNRPSLMCRGKFHGSSMRTDLPVGFNLTFAAETFLRRTVRLQTRMLLCARKRAQKLSGPRHCPLRMRLAQTTRLQVVRGWLGKEYWILTLALTVLCGLLQLQTHTTQI